MHDNRIKQSYSRDDNQLRVVAELQRGVCVCVCASLSGRRVETVDQCLI